MKIEFDLLKDLFFVPVIAAWKKKKKLIIKDYSYES